MRFSRTTDMLSGTITYTLVFTREDFITALYNPLDLALFEDMRISADVSIADNLLALECVARGIERAQDEAIGR